MIALLLVASLQQQTIDRRIPIAPDASIRVLNLVGSIRVTGWDKDTLAVKGRLPAGTGKFFYFGGSGRAAKFGVEIPEGIQDQSADLEVMVPKRARLWIKAATAEITISDFAGGLDLYSVSGRIQVRASPQEVNAESMDGGIDLSGITPFARLKTGSGNITVSGSAEDLTATTVSGGITVRDEGFRRGRLESVTGDLSFEGPIPHGGSLSLESHSGTIELQLPAAVAAEFSISNFQGDIRNDLNDRRAVAARDRGGRELTFTTGLGGADVTIRNFKGLVSLKKKE